jgi:hypothetical protein
MGQQFARNSVNTLSSIDFSKIGTSEAEGKSNGADGVLSGLSREVE